MVRRFFRDSAIYVIPAALSSGMSFFLFPFYAHLFTPREYGAFDLLTLTGILVGWTVALEIYQGVGRFVVWEKDAALSRSYASTALWFAVISYAVFASIVELFATPISHVLLGPEVDVGLLRVAIAWMCVQGVLSIVAAQLRWQLRPGAFALGGVINAVFTVMSSAALVFGARLGVEGAILGQLIGSFVALSYSLLATRGTFCISFSLKRCKEMLAFSVPLVPSSVGIFLNLYADRLVIQHARSLSEVGLYGVGYRLAMIISLLLAGFQGAAMPLILARQDAESTRRDLARIFRIFSALALSILVALTILATPMLRLLAAPEYQRAASVVPFLVISTLFAGINMFAPGLIIAKKTATTAKLTALGGVSNLLLAVLLVPPLGIVGAGIATATTSLAWFVAIMAASQKYYPVPHKWRGLVSAWLVVVAFLAISLAILPTARSQALSTTTLVVRVALVLAGLTLSARLALGREELRGVSRAVVRLTTRQRRAAGAA